MFRFMLAEDSLEGTVVAKRIEELVGDNSEKSGIYKPRSGKINGNMHQFTKE